MAQLCQRIYLVVWLRHFYISQCQPDGSVKPSGLAHALSCTKPCDTRKVGDKMQSLIITTVRC